MTDSFMRWGLSLIGAFLASCLVALPFVSQASAQQGIYCLNGNKDSRYLVIEVEDPNTGLPCTVIDKTDRENPKMLWRAEHQRAFCRDRMRKLVGRLTGQGWMCVTSQDRISQQPGM